MSATTKTFSNNNPPAVEDEDLNGFKQENNQLIESAGQSLNTFDNGQTSKAVSMYSTMGDFYREAATSSANAYVLKTHNINLSQFSMFPIYTLKEGQRIRFEVVNQNTGSSTVNVANTGVKNIKYGTSDIPSGLFIQGKIVELVYNSASDNFQVSNSSVMNLTNRLNGVNGLAVLRAEDNGTGSGRSILSIQGSHVSHGMTDVAPSNSTFSAIVENSGSIDGAGGNIWRFLAKTNGGADKPIQFESHGSLIEGISTQYSNSGSFMFNAFKKDGTWRTSINSNSNLLVLQNDDLTNFLVKGNGDLLTYGDNTTFISNSGLHTIKLTDSTATNIGAYGKIEFSGKNGINQDTVFVDIVGKSFSTGNNSEDGGLELNAMVDGSFKNVLTVRQDILGINRIPQTADTSYKLQIDGSVKLTNNKKIAWEDAGGTISNVLYLDNSDDLLINNDTTGDISFGLGGTEKARLIQVGSSAGLKVVGDIYTVQWTDFSSTSITGWSSTTTKKIFYKKIGKTVIMNYDIEGTSNSAITKIGLPFTVPSGSMVVRNRCAISKDNGADQNESFGEVLSAGVEITIYKDFSAINNWTASGTKRVAGQITYEAF